MDSSVVVIGGGPAGAAAGRLLASWGHRVVIVCRAAASGGSAHGLAESLPPSSRKLLATIGVLEEVERAGFYRTTGNTVWWGARDQRVESFADGTAGLQVFRPDFDRVLLTAAAAAGADVRENVSVRAVEIGDGRATVEVLNHGDQGRRERLSCAWVLDCSGRAGVLARRFRTPGTRMYALVGEWHAADGWDVPDPTHTLVEAYGHGWTWSVPISSAVRHVGVMIDGPSPRAAGKALADAYRSELAETSAFARVLDAASLHAVWSCDASTYSSRAFAGPHYLLVGDAGSFIDPLSSHGVKKALASAWMAAVAANTCLVDPQREVPALEFFSRWERDVEATHARRSRDFAVEAAARHAHRFWQDRAAAPAGEEADRIDRAEIEAALRAIRGSESLDFELDMRGRVRKQAVIRGREIVLEDALAPAQDGRLAARDAAPVRFVDNVDVVALAQLASRCRQVPDLFDAYCRTVAPAPLPSVLGGLSWLVAAGVLRQRTAISW